MNLDHVTITGADDSILPSMLIPLSEEFPWVEWGILASSKHQGKTTRFPSFEWIRKLQTLAGVIPMNLSLHVCGRWIRQLLIGVNEIPPELLIGFQRVQLNFHAERALRETDKFVKALAELGKRQIIFQIDGAFGRGHMESIYEWADKFTFDAVPLYDLSHGAGTLPQAWPQAEFQEAGEIRGDVRMKYHGYAGGLGPDNLAVQIPLINKAAPGPTRVWVDMETRVRSNNDALFDLGKVRACLEAARPAIEGCFVLYGNPNSERPVGIIDARANRDKSILTPDIVGAFPVGVYRLHWMSGGSSLASVGVDAAGKHWYAPANWVAVPSFDWSKVKSVELIEKNFQQCNG